MIDLVADVNCHTDKGSQHWECSRELGKDRVNFTPMTICDAEERHASRMIHHRCFRYGLGIGNRQLQEQKHADGLVIALPCRTFPARFGFSADYFRGVSHVFTCFMNVSANWVATAV